MFSGIEESRDVLTESKNMETFRKRKSDKASWPGFILYIRVSNFTGCKIA